MNARTKHQQKKPRYIGVAAVAEQAVGDQLARCLEGLNIGPYTFKMARAAITAMGQSLIDRNLL